MFDKSHSVDICGHTHSTVIKQLVFDNPLCMNLKLLIATFYFLLIVEASALSFSDANTTSPSIFSSVAPKNAPTIKPSKASKAPSHFPTIIVPPSQNPTLNPTLHPTQEITERPTVEETYEPTPTAELPPKKPPCLCMFASACVQDSDCCPGLYCQIHAGWTMCVEPAYNASLCVTSLYGYGCQSNSNCCNPNATCENKVCTLFCGTSPTRSPSTIKPTKKPSNAPSLFPTLLPTSLRPSHVPSIYISRQPTTLMPTEVPTELPTYSPTELPTIKPSPYKPSRYPSQGRPTKEPTVEPTTTSPTYQATLQSVTVVTFDSFISFLNVSSGLDSSGQSFDTSSRSDIINDVDNILNIPSGSTSYVEDWPLGETTNYRRSLLTINGTVNIVAHVTIAVAVSVFPEISSPSKLLEHLSKILTQSISSGHFFGTLVYIAAFPDDWAGASVSNITIVNANIVYPPTFAPTSSPIASNSQTKLGSTMTTLLACIIAVSVLLAGVIVYFAVRYFSNRFRISRANKLQSKSNDNGFSMVGADFTEVRTDLQMYECDVGDLKASKDSSQNEEKKP